MLWPLRLTLTFNPRWAMVMNRTHAKGQGQRSFSSVLSGINISHNALWKLLPVLTYRRLQVKRSQCKQIHWINFCFHCLYVLTTHYLRWPTAKGMIQKRENQYVKSTDADGKNHLLMITMSIMIKSMSETHRLSLCTNEEGQQLNRGCSVYRLSVFA